MAQIVTVKNGQTDEIEYPRTVKSALLNDDGTFLNPLTQTNIINDLTTGGATKVLSAEQGKVLQNAISNINVSWDGITGKPTTFAPSAHSHPGLSGTNTVLEVQEYIDFHKNFSSSDYDARMHMDPTTGALEWYSALNSTHSMNITGEINSLKSSVVNGKQEVVNAINGTIGYSSGLTTGSTHADYAWWIQNKVASLYFTYKTSKTATLRGSYVSGGYNNTTWAPNTYGDIIDVKYIPVSMTASELYHIKYNCPITVHSGVLYLSVPANTISTRACITSGGSSYLAFPVGTYQTVEFIVPVVRPSSSSFSFEMRICNPKSIVGQVDQSVTFSISALPSGLTVTALNL